MFEIDYMSLILKVLGSQGRYILVALATFLGSKGLLTPEQIQPWVDANLSIFIAALTYVVVSVWSYLKSLKAQKVEDVAKAVAPAATDRILKK